MARRSGSWLLSLTILAGCAGAASDSPGPSGSSPQPSATASDGPPTAAPSPSPSAGPTVISSQGPPTRLAADSWASVVTDVVNLRDGPSLDANVLGAARHGDLVHVSGSPTISDSIGWYPVAAVVGSGRTGWMAGEQGQEIFLEPVIGTTTQGWCGRMEAGTTAYASPGVHLTAFVQVGGLKIPSSLFDPAMQGALAVAWGADANICMNVTVTASAVTKVTVPSFAAEACGEGSWGAQGELALNIDDPVLKHVGVDLGRGFWLHDAMLGFETYGGSSIDLPNLGKVVMLSSDAKSEACMTIVGHGGLGSTELDMGLSTTGCVAVAGRSGIEIGLAHFSATYGAQSPWSFAIGPGSDVGPEFVAGAVLMAKVHAAGGPAGAITVQAVEDPGCAPLAAP